MAATGDSGVKGAHDEEEEGKNKRYLRTFKCVEKTNVDLHEFYYFEGRSFLLPKMAPVY